MTYRCYIHARCYRQTVVKDTNQTLHAQPFFQPQLVSQRQNGSNGNHGNEVWLRDAVDVVYRDILTPAEVVRVAL
jgi:hypothetical protein